MAKVPLSIKKASVGGSFRVPQLFRGPRMAGCTVMGGDLVPGNVSSVFRDSTGCTKVTICDSEIAQVNSESVNSLLTRSKSGRAAAPDESSSENGSAPSVVDRSEDVPVPKLDLVRKGSGERQVPQAPQAGQVPVDHDLVSLAREGDREAFKELVHRHQRRAFHIAFEILKTREDAEDVVQESFVKAFLCLGDFRGQSSFYTWLYRIVYNMSIDYRRKIMRRGGPPIPLEEARAVIEVREGVATGQVPNNPQEQVLQNEKFSTLQRALDTLSEEHRLVLVLREVEGLHYDEIARIVGVPKGTIMSRLFYARKKIQEIIQLGGGL